MASIICKVCVFSLEIAKVSAFAVTYIHYIKWYAAKAKGTVEMVLLCKPGEKRKRQPKSRLRQGQILNSMCCTTCYMIGVKFNFHYSKKTPFGAVQAGLCCILVIAALAMFQWRLLSRSHLWTPAISHPRCHNSLSSLSLGLQHFSFLLQYRRSESSSAKGKSQEALLQGKKHPTSSVTVHCLQRLHAPSTRDARCDLPLPLYRSKGSLENRGLMPERAQNTQTNDPYFTSVPLSPWILTKWSCLRQILCTQCSAH